MSRSRGSDPNVAGLRQRFESALITALVGGQPPHGATGLEPHTVAAVTLVAAEHPDATADVIAQAYDAFCREHG